MMWPSSFSLLFPTFIHLDEDQVNTKEKVELPELRIRIRSLRSDPAFSIWERGYIMAQPDLNLTENGHFIFNS